MVLPGTRGHTVSMVIDEQAPGTGCRTTAEVSQRLLAELRHQRALNEKLAYECALLKRLKFAAKSERHSAEQRNLLEEELDSDLAAVEHEIGATAPTAAGHRQAATQAHAAAGQSATTRDPPRTHVHDMPVRLPTQAHWRGCGRSWTTCPASSRWSATSGASGPAPSARPFTQAPVAAHVIDKGIPTAGLLAQVLVAKYADHQPLYRQENIFGRAGLAIPRSTLAQWVGTCGARLQPLVDALKTEMLGHRVLHADETPVAMLKPGNGKTHRAYLWAYAPGAFEATRAVVYDFCESRAGEHARAFLGDWRGSLICDDYAGYKASFSQGVTEAGCLAHAGASSSTCTRPTKSQIAEFALAAVRPGLRDRTGSQGQTAAAAAAGAPAAQPTDTGRLAPVDGAATPAGGGNSATAKALDYSLKALGGAHALRR